VVVRTWKAYTSAARLPAYEATVRKIVLPHFANVPGCLGSKFLHRCIDDEVEILVLTFWESMETARGLAGDDKAQVYVPPEIAATLDRYDQEVALYEVLVEHAGGA
jgi:hypothetical protein